MELATYFLCNSSKFHFLWKQVIIKYYLPHRFVVRITWAKSWNAFERSHGMHLAKSQISLTAAAAKSLQLCPTLCDPIDSSPPGSPVPGILQARTLEWVAISFSNAWKWKVKIENEVAQLCPTLRHTMNCSPPGSSVHGIFRARGLEWGAIAFSKSHLSTP